MFDGDKLTKKMKEKGFTNAKMAEMVNNYGVAIKEDSFKAYRQGRANPRMEVFDAIVKVLDAVEQDFFDNSKEQRRKIVRREMLEHADQYKGLVPNAEKMDDILILPLIPAGAGAEVFHNECLIETICLEKRLLSSDIRNRIDKNTATIRVIGNSMQPRINENDVLFVDMANGRDIAHGDGIYLVRYDSIVQIKQIQFIGHNKINIISANSDYPIFSPHKEGMDWEILGKPFMRWAIQQCSKLEIIGDDIVDRQNNNCFIGNRSTDRPDMKK